MRDAVKAEIHAVTGLDPMLGDERFAVAVSVRRHLHNVVLGDGRNGEPAVAADELTARLRYFPLLAGRVEIADVTLRYAPVINVTFSAAGRTNWSGLIVSLARALQPDPGRTASFSEIGIQDGTVIVHDQGKRATERLESVNFQVAWPSISRSFGANGHFVWNEEPVEASLTLSDFLAALTGDRSGVKLRVSSAPLNVAFDGTATDQPTLKLDGVLDVESPSLRDALRWTDKSKVPFGGFGPFSRFARRATSAAASRLCPMSTSNLTTTARKARSR